MSTRKPTSAETAILLACHGLLSGAFIVAYATGGEDTYAMHVFAGYTVLAVLAARLLTGLLAPAGSPLRLPRPRIAPTLDWLGRVLSGDDAARMQRSPLAAWMATALLAGLTAAAVSGAVADVVLSVEDLHEALGEAMLPLVLGHIALVLALHGLKHLPLSRLKGAWS